MYIHAKYITKITDDVMGRAGMGRWVGAHGGKTGRVPVGKEWSISVRVYYGAPPGDIKCPREKHACCLLRIPRPSHKTMSYSQHMRYMLLVVCVKWVGVYLLSACAILSMV